MSDSIKIVPLYTDLINEQKNIIIKLNDNNKKLLKENEELKSALNDINIKRNKQSFNWVDIDLKRFHGHDFDLVLENNNIILRDEDELEEYIYDMQRDIFIAHIRLTDDNISQISSILNLKEDKIDILSNKDDYYSFKLESENKSYGVINIKTKKLHTTQNRLACFMLYEHYELLVSINVNGDIIIDIYDNKNDELKATMSIYYLDIESIENYKYSSSEFVLIFKPSQYKTKPILGVCERFDNLIEYVEFGNEYDSYNWNIITESKYDSLYDSNICYESIDYISGYWLFRNSKKYIKIGRTLSELFNSRIRIDGVNEYRVCINSRMIFVNNTYYVKLSKLLKQMDNIEWNRLECRDDEKYIIDDNVIMLVTIDNESVVKARYCKFV